MNGGGRGVGSLNHIPLLFCESVPIVCENYSDTQMKAFFMAQCSESMNLSESMKIEDIFNLEMKIQLLIMMITRRMKCSAH